MYVTSPNLPATMHGFTARHGGVSTGPYTSLNLGDRWGDGSQAVAENRRRLGEAAHFDPNKLYQVGQAHGREVVVLKGGETVADIDARPADALVTQTPGLVLSVRTADCVPILLADELGHVGAVHAGWRGTAAGIVTAAIDALCELGAKPDLIHAAIGPCICAKCYEIGDDVAKQFEQVAPAALIREPGKKLRLDLAAANHLQLLEGGVNPANVWRSGRCTMHEPNDFYSYRRDGNKTGQHLAFIAAD